MATNWFRVYVFDINGIIKILWKYENWPFYNLTDWFLLLFFFLKNINDLGVCILKIQSCICFAQKRNFSHFKPKEKYTYKDYKHGCHYVYIIHLVVEL